MLHSTFDPELVTARSNLYRQVRAYFESMSVLEVDVPVLGVSGATDPYLASFQCSNDSQSLYLQTSPEFFLKRLLSQGSGDIYALCKAFRSGEVGAKHNPEFTLLEWYRLGFSLQNLIDDLLSLLRYLGLSLPVSFYSYGEIFKKFVGINPHQASVAELQTAVLERGFDSDLERSAALDFLFTEAVEPSFSEGLVVVTDYPVCQAALAKVGVNIDGEPVAQRFELYINGMELANGYAELTDADEQAKRFDADNRLRIEQGLPEVCADKALINALREGMPECAGVALGMDRVLMVLMGKSCIADCMHFSWENL